MKQKIRADLIIDKLHAHIMAKNGTMQASAVTAALGLLRKIIPDLQSVDMKGKLEGRDLRQYSDAELIAFIAAAAPIEPSQPQLLPAPTKDNSELH
jgi:hypothetical protein